MATRSLRGALDPRLLLLMNAHAQETVRVLRRNVRRATDPLRLAIGPLRASVRTRRRSASHHHAVTVLTPLGAAATHARLRLAGIVPPLRAISAMLRQGVVRGSGTTLTPGRPVARSVTLPPETKIETAGITRARARAAHVTAAIRTTTGTAPRATAGIAGTMTAAAAVVTIRMTDVAALRARQHRLRAMDVPPRSHRTVLYLARFPTVVVRALVTELAADMVVAGLLLRLLPPHLRLAMVLRLRTFISLRPRTLTSLTTKCMTGGVRTASRCRDVTLVTTSRAVPSMSRILPLTISSLHATLPSLLLSRHRLGRLPSLAAT